MKKILKILFLIWIIVLIYFNFFQKPSRSLCAMGKLPSGLLVSALLLGIFSIGLPFSYILKYVIDQFAKMLFPKSAEKKQSEFFSQIVFVTKTVFYIFVLPLVLGTLVIELFPWLEIIFSKSYLSFLFQVFGLAYLYLAVFGKLNKCFGISIKTEQKTISQKVGQ